MTKYIKEINQSGYLAVLYQALVQYGKNTLMWLWCPLLEIRCTFGKNSVHSYIANGASPPLGGECKEYSSFPNRALDDADNIDSRSQYYEPTSSD